MYECESLSADDCRFICDAERGAGVFCGSSVVCVYGVCGFEFVSVGVYGLVPDDGDFEEGGGAGGVGDVSLRS